MSWTREAQWIIMRLIIAVLVHAVAFWATVGLIGLTTVSDSVWIVVYTAGMGATAASTLPCASGIRAKTWRATLMHSCLFAALFAGADFALTELGNSARPRAPLPMLVGGLDLHFLLLPGVTSVALGALAGKAASMLAIWLAKQSN